VSRKKDNKRAAVERPRTRYGAVARLVVGRSNEGEEKTLKERREGTSGHSLPAYLEARRESFYTLHETLSTLLRSYGVKWSLIRTGGLGGKGLGGKGLKYEKRGVNPAGDRTRAARRRRAMSVESKHTEVYCNQSVHSEREDDEGEGSMNPVQRQKTGCIGKGEMENEMSKTKGGIKD
jgi:hypothetical protein